MVQIYDDYSDEPKDSFQPLPEQLSCEFYNLEMDSFTDDISFYESLLPDAGAVLELGCGAGRITDNLATEKRPLTGIDLSLESLVLALNRANPSTRYVCMDMMQLAFLTTFSAVIVPYNTLNLLTSRENIERCVVSCKTVLQPAGQFIAQIYIPPHKMLSQLERSFQFQMLDLPGGGKLIKEILKRYIGHNQTIEIEERYRVRPMQHGRPNEDWNRVYSIAAFPVDTWLELFSENGFKVIELFHSYGAADTKAKESSSLLVHLQL